MKLPKVRTRDITVQELEKEMLLYDFSCDKAFVLNETLAVVYHACGSNQSFADLNNQYKFSDDLIYLSLDILKRHDLLADESSISPIVGMKRREIVKKIGLSTMIALPVISSLVAPDALRAASNCVNPGGLAPGASTSYSCSGTTASCQNTCSTDFLARSECCSGNSELQSGCAEFTVCPCICAA